MYRGLASSHPAAFEAKLAQSLGALGQALSDQPEEARDAVTEAIQLLVPPRSQVPDDHYSLWEKLTEQRRALDRSARVRRARAVYALAALLLALLLAGLLAMLWG